jgi:hypothetical protein
MSKIIRFSLILSAALALVSCNKSDDPQPVKEIEIFERVPNGNFARNSINVGKIEVLSNRLFYSDRSNPGYISDDLSVEQLCCYALNNQVHQQTFSNDYAVGVNNYLRSFIVYYVNQTRNPESIFLPYALGQSYEDAYIWGGENLGLFELNDNLLLTFVHVKNQRNLYIFDLEKHASSYGLSQDTTGIIKVDIAQLGIRNPNCDLDRPGKMSRFGEGWLVSFVHNCGLNAGTFFVDKNGKLSKVDANYEGVFYHLGHTILSNGKLVAWDDNNLYLSLSGSLEDLRPIATLPFRMEFRALGNRLITFFGGDNLFEAMEFNEYSGQPIDFKRIDTQGLEFANLNDVRLFGERVFVAANTGLFLKSESDFWTYVKEIDDRQSNSLLLGNTPE